MYQHAKNRGRLRISDRWTPRYNIHGAIAENVQLMRFDSNSRVGGSIQNLYIATPYLCLSKYVLRSFRSFGSNVVRGVVNGEVIE
jgi:hypothetical protein